MYKEHAKGPTELPRFCPGAHQPSKDIQHCGTPLLRTRHNEVYRCSLHLHRYPPSREYPRCPGGKWSLPSPAHPTFCNPCDPIAPVPFIRMGSSREGRSLTAVANATSGARGSKCPEPCRETAEPRRPPGHQLRSAGQPCGGWALAQGRRAPARSAGCR